MYKGLLLPPVVFIVLFAVMVFFAWLFSRWAYKKSGASEDGTKAYSCGEEFSGHLIQPDYSQFFPFAFFFTILHVVAMVIATIPTETMENFAIAVIYIVGAITGLFILLRK